MITRRKIAAAGNGKKLMRYLREATTVEHASRQLAQYYGGWDARGTWRRDMAPEIATALGIDPTQAPSDEALERLFEARRADNGEKWTHEKREISAVDLQAAPHKSVTLAAVLAESDAERASILQAIWRANDYAMKAFA
ncbi:MAG: relaxase domain-containing protein, partial [Rhodopila sp.]